MSSLPQKNKLKMSVGSIISNPISDEEIIFKEGKKKQIYILFCLIIDLLISISINSHDCYFYNDYEKIRLIKFIISSVIVFLIIIIFIFCVLLKRYVILLFTRFIYIIIGGIYYTIRLGIDLFNLADEEYFMEDIDIIFFFVNLLSIIPRVIAYLYMKIYSLDLIKLEETKRVEEHQNFIEKLVNRIEEGYTRWSMINPSPENEKEIICQENSEDTNINKDNKEISKIEIDSDNNSEKIEVSINGNKLTESIDDNSTDNGLGKK